MFEKLFSNLDMLFICLGLPAQLIFTSRFVVQWLHSEKHKKSMVPNVFWWLSLAGSLGLLSYGLLRGEPILILGQSMGSAIYTRNLVLIAREKNDPQAAAHHRETEPIGAEEIDT